MYITEYSNEGTSSIALSIKHLNLVEKNKKGPKVVDEFRPELSIRVSQEASLFFHHSDFGQSLVLRCNLDLV